MTNILSSDSIKKTYETGLQSFNVASKSTTNETSDLTNLDFDKILDLKDKREVIADIPAQLLYLNLKRQGIEDNLAILEYISNDQFKRFYDYDVWINDELSLTKSLNWIRLLQEISNEESYKRFRSLDEEYQIALLMKHLDVFVAEEYEDVPESIKDSHTMMPCQKYFYRFEGINQSESAILDTLLKSAMTEDMEYVYSLLSHAAMMPPNETELQLLQFRNARIEEDGFIPYADSLSFFWPDYSKVIYNSDFKNFSVDLYDRINLQNSVSQNNHLINTNTSNDFLEQVMQKAKSTWSMKQIDELQQRITHLANALCSATQIEPEDIQGWKVLHEHILYYLNLGLEYLSHNSVEMALNVLLNIYPKQIFQTSIAIINVVQTNFINNISTLDIIKNSTLNHYVKQKKYGALLNEIDELFMNRLDFSEIETIKATFNRFAMVPTKIEPKSTTLTFKPIATLADLQQMIQTLGITSEKLLNNNLLESENA